MKVTFEGKDLIDIIMQMVKFRDDAVRSGPPEPEPDLRVNIKDTELKKRGRPEKEVNPDEGLEASEA